MIFLFGHLYFTFFDDGSYLFYALFLHLPTRDAQIYFIVLFFISLFPLFSGGKFDLKVIRYLYIILCFFIIQGILYRIFSAFLMIHDFSITVWFHHLPEALVAFVFMQYLLLFAKIDKDKILFGNILMFMSVLAAVQREMAIPYMFNMWPSS